MTVIVYPPFMKCPVCGNLTRDPSRWMNQRGKCDNCSRHDVAREKRLKLLKAFDAHCTCVQCLKRRLDDGKWNGLGICRHCAKNVIYEERKSVREALKNEIREALKRERRSQ